MAYSNGSIYAPVSINDVQRALGMSSGDVATLCKSDRVNPWARYKPIPCLLGGGHNVPRPLTGAERLAERYGMEELMDNFSADAIQSMQDYANQYDENLPFGGVERRAWQTGMFARLSDFAKTNNDGTPANNIGYKHGAVPTTVQVVYGGTTYYLRPIISENERTIYIPQGSTSAKWVLPDDSVWVREYVKYISGQSTSAVVSFDEECLSILDLIGGNTYGNIINGGKSGRILMRGAAIFKWANRGDGYGNDYGEKWRMYNYTLFNFDNPNTYLDFTDGSETQVFFSNVERYALSQIQGEFMVMELWGAYYSNMYQIYPMPGFMYKINITREADQSGINIDGQVQFTRVTMVTGVDPENPGDYDLRLHYRAKATTALSTWYDVAMATINDGTDTYTENILQRTPVVVQQADANGWYELYIASGPYAGTPTYTLTVRQTGMAIDHSKTFVIV